MSKRIFLSVALVVAIVSIGAQVPAMRSVVTQGAFSLNAVASQGSYGERLGTTVDEVVKSLHYQDQKNGRRMLITHAHVMAVMCQENPKLNIAINNGQGFSRGSQEGLTQVIDATAVGLLSGKSEGGRCAYIRGLENGICANPRARVSNPRCSIELGACYFNEKLHQANGNPYRAYIGYNTGSVNRSPAIANGEGSFLAGFNALATGKLCAKARQNPTVWQAMWRKVHALTGGRFATDGAQNTPLSMANWPTDPSSIPTVSNIGQQWWKSPWGQQVAGGQSGGSGASGGGGQPASSYGGQSPYTNAQQYDPYSQSSLGQTEAERIKELLGLATSSEEVSGESDEPEVISVDADENATTDDEALASIAYDGKYLIWATIGVEECILTGGGIRAEGTRGHLYKPGIAPDTEFTLECETPRGKLLYTKEI